MRFVRTLLLFGMSLGLLVLAGFVLTGSTLATPAALAGLGAFLLAVA
jgi:hypothetical protein